MNTSFRGEITHIIPSLPFIFPHLIMPPHSSPMTYLHKQRMIQKGHKHKSSPMTIEGESRVPERDDSIIRFLIHHTYSSCIIISLSIGVYPLPLFLPSLSPFLFSLIFPLPSPSPFSFLPLPILVATKTQINTPMQRGERHEKRKEKGREGREREEELANSVSTSNAL